MSIASEISRLQTAKADIKTAIENKGVNVGDGLIDTYADKISEISVDDDFYNTFWETFQRNGKSTSYYYACAYNRFTDENFKPKYDLIGSAVATSMQNIFYNSTNITEIPVSLICNATSFAGCFYSATKLKTIHKMVVSESITSYSYTFYKNTSLENITIEGIIAANFDVKESPLTVESAKSIITALKDFSGTTKENTCSVSFSDTTLALLEAEGATAPGGITWFEYIESKRWNY